MKVRRLFYNVLSTEKLFSFLHQLLPLLLMIIISQLVCFGIIQVEGRQGQV